MVSADTGSASQKLTAHKFAEAIVSELEAQVDDVESKLTSSGSKFGTNHAAGQQQGSGQGDRFQLMN